MVATTQSEFIAATDAGLPEDLDVLPPGPELARALDRIDRSKLSGADVVTLLRARSRQLAHDQAQLWADIVEVAHCPGEGVERSALVVDFADVEVASALAWTQNAAAKQLRLALDVMKRLPEVHEAMLNGWVDQAKAVVFAETTKVLNNVEELHKVVDAVLREAPRLTTVEIGRKLRRLIAQVDPDAAKKRARRSCGQRRIVAGADTSGTGWIKAFGLPIDRAAAAMERLDGLARAARATGDQRTLDQLRADILLDLMDGAHQGPEPAPRKGVIELTVPLTTLMGLEDLPGDLAGWGPVCADIARQTAAQRTDETSWRFTVRDEDGSIVSHGTTRRRPSPGLARFVRANTSRCVAPGCDRPACQCELDHRVRYVDGGATDEVNLNPLCGLHHHCKDEGDWRYVELRQNVFLWISPRGRCYLVDRQPEVW